MAKLSARGGTILMWASATSGYSYALRPNGQVLIDRGFGWKEWRHLKATVIIEDYVAKVKAEPTHLIGERAPSWETLMRWEQDGICQATDGCKVEPDGTCPHGKLSWLKVRGIV